MTISEADAIHTIERTNEALLKRGYCVWTCSNLDNDKIFVIPGEFAKLRLPHEQYPVYTVDELKELSGASIESIRLIHAAKKLVPGTTVVK